ncbi:MAG: hypothetical protein ACRD3A_01585 [Terriglobales bacterium]
MKSLAVKIGLAVLGLVLVLGWWSFKSRWGGDGSGGAVNGIPDKVWEGGGHKITFRAEGSGSMRVSAWFSGHDAASHEEKRSLETRQKVSAGTQTFNIDAPRNSGATFEATAEEPKVGDTISITVTVDGKQMCQESQKLTEPLQSGYAFGAQCEIHDFAKGSAGPGEAESSE